VRRHLAEAVAAQSGPEPDLFEPRMLIAVATIPDHSLCYPAPSVIDERGEWRRWIQPQDRRLCGRSTSWPRG
jgi:hypothetical protein